MQNNNNNIDILFKEIKKIYIYKKFPKICVLRTKLNWITQKQNQQKTMIHIQNNTPEHFLEEKKHLYHRYGNHLVLPDIFQIFLQLEPF